MPVNNWLPRALARAEVKTITPANVGIGNTFSYTINNKTITVTATAGTVANVTGLAVAALNASTIPEFAEVTWSDSTTHVTGTHDTPGTPFELTSSASGGTATNITATTTAATGPNHWDDVNNWSAGTVPADGEDLNIDLSLSSIYYGLPQSSIEPASMLVYTSSRTQNTMGLPRINALGYSEYRSRKLLIGPLACTIDADSPRVIIDFGSDPTACEVLRSGATSSGEPAVQLSGSSASNTWEFVGGNVALAYFDDEAGAGASLKVGSNATVYVGDDADITEVVSVGTLDFRGTADDFICRGNTAIVRGNTPFDMLWAEGGGTIDYRSSGAVAEAIAGGSGNGTIDCSSDLSARTFSSTTIATGGKIVDPYHTITHSTGIVLDDSVREVTAA